MNEWADDSVGHCGGWNNNTEIIIASWPQCKPHQSIFQFWFIFNCRLLIVGKAISQNSKPFGRQRPCAYAIGFTHWPKQQPEQNEKERITTTLKHSKSKQWTSAQSTINTESRPAAEQSWPSAINFGVRGILLLVCECACVCPQTHFSIFLDAFAFTTNEKKNCVCQRRAYRFTFETCAFGMFCVLLSCQSGDEQPLSQRGVSSSGLWVSVLKARKTDWRDPHALPGDQCSHQE